jgi:ATP-dependent protease ClpP protease subunit
MPKKVKVKGAIISNDWKWIYDWFGYDATCPKDIEDALNESNGGDVELEINSGGGDVYAGSEIYTMLKSYSGNVIGKVVGIAASAASVIGMGCTKLLMTPTGQVMIHNVSSGARGDYRDMQHSADVLQNWNVSIANSYRIKTGMDEKKLLDLMDKETWLNAQQALEMGFVDEIMFTQENALVASATETQPGSDVVIPFQILDKLRNSGLLKMNNIPAFSNIGTLKGDEIMNFEAILAKLSEEERAVIMDTLKAEQDKNAENVTEIETLKAQLAEATKEETMEGSTDEDLLNTLDPKVRALVENAQKDAQSARESEATAKAALRAIEDEKQLANFTKVAEKFDKLPINAAEFAPIFKNFASADKEGFEKLEALLTAANECVDKGALFQSSGTTTNTDGRSAWEQIQNKADELLAAEPKMGKEKALLKAMQENKDLYAQYLNEEHNHAKSASTDGEEE